MPYAMVVAFDFADVAPMSAHAITTLMAHINSTLNPILFFVLNPGFHESLHKFRVYIGVSNSSILKGTILNAEMKTMTRNATHANA